MHIFGLWNREETVCNSSDCYESTTTLTMQDRVLSLNFIINAVAINGMLCKWIVSVIWIWRWPMTNQGLQKIWQAKYQTMGFFYLCIWDEKETCSVETEEVVAFAVEKATIKITHGTCCHMWMYHGLQCTKLSVMCCSSTYTKSNKFNKFNITILLRENRSLSNSLHGWKWTNIGLRMFCEQMTPIFT